MQESKPNYGLGKCWKQMLVPKILRKRSMEVVHFTGRGCKTILLVYIDRAKCAKRQLLKDCFSCTAWRYTLN